MKYYLITTGAAFGLLALAHFFRVYAEGTRLLTEPIFVISTVGSIALCGWAIFFAPTIFAFRFTNEFAANRF